MPDRRQGDRRESNNGIASKKIQISLGAFVFIVLYIVTVTMLTLTCIVVSKEYYNKGYSVGYNDGVEDFKNGKIIFDSEVDPEEGAAVDEEEATSYVEGSSEGEFVSEEYKNR